MEEVKSQLWIGSVDLTLDQEVMDLIEDNEVIIGLCVP